jgi:TM2 domain-containing membrane protein YozV
MRGQVLGVDTRTGDGLVSGDDGRRYRFRPEDWADRGEPAVGLHVDFETDGVRALSLLPVPGGTPAIRPAAAPPEPVSDRNRVVAALLAFFLGPLGAHRFYLGRTGSGIAMLLLTCTMVGLLVTAPLALVETVRYLLMSDRDFARRYARA